MLVAEQHIQFLNACQSRGIADLVAVYRALKIDLDEADVAGVQGYLDANLHMKTN